MENEEKELGRWKGTYPIICSDLRYGLNRGKCRMENEENELGMESKYWTSEGFIYL